MADLTAERSLVPAITRAVAVLDLLAASTAPLGVSAIGRALGLPKSSVANLCATLADTELVRPVPGGFVLGPHLARLGTAYLAGVDEVALLNAALHDDQVTIARLQHALRQLADDLGRGTVADTPNRPTGE